MQCELVPIASGGTAIVCGPTRRCKCGRRGRLLCDWKVATRRSGTCDAAICNRCTTSPAPGKDLCSKHAAEWRDWQLERSRA